MPGGYYLSGVVKVAIWVLRAEGVSEAEISRGLGMPKRTVSRYLRRMGGVRPRLRRWAGCCLSSGEREGISRGIARGGSARAIGRVLGRSHTAICRGIDRCGGRRCYRAYVAERAAWERARRPRATRLEVCPELGELVIERLGQEHSRQQISGWL
jgi:IS30 family transposase